MEKVSGSLYHLMCCADFFCKQKRAQLTKWYSIIICFACRILNVRSIVCLQFIDWFVYGFSVFPPFTSAIQSYAIYLEWCCIIDTKKINRKFQSNQMYVSNSEIWMFDGVGRQLPLHCIRRYRHWPWWWLIEYRNKSRRRRRKAACARYVMHYIYKAIRCAAFFGLFVAIEF